jgi:hypothetical protein
VDAEPNYKQILLGLCVGVALASDAKEMMFAISHALRRGRLERYVNAFEKLCDSREELIELLENEASP